MAWLTELARPAAGPVPWARMAHAAVAVCVPLGLGIALGQPVPGLLGAMGGLLAVVVDPGGPYPLRARRIGTAATAGAAAGIVVGGQLHGRGGIAVIVLMLIAAVSAVLSTAGNIASVTGLQLLVYSILGTGPLGTIRPWWEPPAGVLAGAAWGVLLLAPTWVISPLAPEQRSVAAAYRALAAMMAAIGTGEFAARRRDAITALNAAYDALAARRATAAGRDPEQVRLVRLLAQTHALAEAATTLADEGRRPPPAATALLVAAASAVDGTGPVPATPAFPAATPGERALRDALTDVAGLLAGRSGPAPDRPAETGQAETGQAETGQAAGGGQAGRSGTAGDRWDRLRDAAARIAGGRLVQIFAVRVMVSIGVAAVVSDLLPVQRSYWILLTVAIVLRPDFGSVFARGVQRGIGTVIGAVAGAAILAVVPYGPLLLVPCAVLAALLPYGRSRNFGLFSMFLTPLVVVLIDLLTATGWRLAEDRLIDTLLGCAIALVIGYAPWPTAWHAHLPGQFAKAVDKVSRYTEQALLIRSLDRPGQRRQTYRALSDLRTEFQRMMAEPPAVSRQAAGWWPALIALENVMDKVTASAVRLDRGASPPAADEVAQVTAALAEVSRAVAAGTRPSGLPLPVTGSPAIRPAAAGVREVQRALAAASGSQAAG
jgi:uncharacterized membrane protein YccC